MKSRIFPVRIICAAILVSCANVLPVAGCARPAPPSLSARGEKALLRIEVLDDDLFRFEYAPPPDVRQETIGRTPMIARADFPGPSRLNRPGNGRLETAEGQVGIDRSDLSTRFSMTACGEEPVQHELFSVRLMEMTSEGCVIAIDAPEMTHAWGLGEQFPKPGEANGDWVGRVRMPGCEFGNRMVPYKGGAVGNAMFPVLYMMAADGTTCALFLDDLSALEWDLSTRPWRIKSTGAAVRGYVLLGESLSELRSEYMDLVGRPPVPPKAAFGLWISEYGYEDWAELESKLASLRKSGFPVDGFILDLQWFGGVDPGGEKSRMGRLAWDRKRFPDPRRKIAELRAREGVHIVPIEESYVTRGLPEHKRLASKGYLVRAMDGTPVFIKSWWGHGGMIDWTKPAAGDFWHDWKRKRLIDDGVVGHWTDLGEPEDYAASAVYHGVPGGGGRHRDVHNYYNFAWAESIYRGYLRGGPGKRPFIMSRSGVSGIQRFGAAMWSGDIGSNLPSLAAHFNTQLHMSMSGMDYYGSDLGGFKRTALDGDLNEMYTQWFAAGAMVDVPVRPHTANTSNQYETAPDRVGDSASNLANIRLRYELIPYIYSLAHRAYLHGEAVFPPPVYCFPGDPALRECGDQKMIGDALMTALVAEYGRRTRDVYLPRGRWFDWYSAERIESAGEVVRNVPLYREGRFRLPLFARAGAIVPLMHVDDQTMNTTGRRRDGTRRDELVLRVFESLGSSKFTLYEDDGWSTAYQGGRVRTTLIRQDGDVDGVELVVDGACGDYEDAPVERAVVVKLTTGGRTQCSGVMLHDEPLARHRRLEDLEKSDSGWCQTARCTIVAKTARLPVRRAKRLRFSLTAD